MSKEKSIRKGLSKEAQYRKFLPYRRLIGELKDYNVVLEKKIQEFEFSKELPKMKSEYVELKLIENRNGEKKTTSIIDTRKHIMWGVISFPLLEKIIKPLNDKSEYKWDKIEEIIINFLKENNKYKSFDYTLGNLTSFVGDVFMAKFELTNQDFEDLIKADDFPVKEIRLNVFSKLKVFKELRNISSSALSDEEKGKKIIDAILKYHHSFFMPHFTFVDPFYQDDFEPLFIIEEDELFAMERLFEREKEKIKNKYLDDERMQRILIEELYNTYYWKRIESFENRRVLGAGLSFEEKEDRMRKEAQFISYELTNILFSWGILGLDVTRKSVSHYWDYFEERAWERQKDEMGFQKQENKWKQDIQEMKKVQAGQWDSNTMTLLGVIIAIFFSILFGAPSLFNIEWYCALILALSVLSLWAVLFKLKKIRRFIIRNIKKLLSVEHI